MQTIQCPNCNSDIIVDDEASRGDLFNCANCQAEIEIASLHPLRISLLQEEDHSSN